METRYFRQLVTKDGLKSPVEEMHRREFYPRVNNVLPRPVHSMIHEAVDVTDGPVVNYRTYRYRRQVVCVLFEYEEE